MGLLVDGVWQDDVSRTKDGHFIRPTTQFRNWVTPDGSAGPLRRRRLCRRGRPLSPLCFACLPVGAPHHHFPQAEGARERHLDVDCLARHAEGRLDLQRKSKGSTGDSVNGKSKLSEIYLLADPRYSGRVSVPVLWDKKRKTIVNNESPEIIRMLNSAFDAFHQCAHRLLSGTACAPRSTASTT